MPGLKQLEEFEKNLNSLGDEARVRASRGEKFPERELPHSYEEDDSEDFADGLPTGPHDFAGEAASPSILTDDEDLPDAAQEVSDDDGADDFNGEISIPQASGGSLADEDFDDIFDEGDVPPDVLPDYEDFRSDDFSGANEAAEAENPFLAEEGGAAGENLADSDFPSAAEAENPFLAGEGGAEGEKSAEPELQSADDAENPFLAEEGGAAGENLADSELQSAAEAENPFLAEEDGAEGEKSAESEPQSAAEVENPFLAEEDGAEGEKSAESELQSAADAENPFLAEEGGAEGEKSAESELQSAAAAENPFLAEEGGAAGEKSAESELQSAAEAENPFLAEEGGAAGENLADSELQSAAEAENPFLAEEDFGIPISVDPSVSIGDLFHFSEDADDGEVSNLVEEEQESDENVWLDFFSEENRAVFMQNLARYPLNLRREIEKILLRADVPDQTIAEIFRLVVKKSSAKAVASSVSGFTGYFIETPADFEARSDESFAALSMSASYFIKNRLVPVAAAAAFFLGIGVALAHLGKNFVLNPWLARNAYKEGVALVQGEFYPQAELKFSEGMSYSKSKKWFLRFADAYREKRQYDKARKIFELGESCFPNEKSFPLRYAEMEFYDLGNFERAAEIVKRDVLDNFVNLPEGILLLGDICLDWATEMEIPEKFDNALSQYAALLEHKGQSDVALSRMLRYFIRTDNLAEVLPLKSYFYVKNPKNSEKKLSAGDLAELGEFLLDKLYGDIAPADEHLRAYIEDVKDILEQAVNSDPSNPLPQYDMARYFIETENLSLAQAQLEIALKTFSEKKVKTRRELAKNIDSYRLLGEIHTEGGEYLKAAQTLEDGILLYEESAASTNFGASQKIGRLYADLADIEYFISGEAENANRDYRSAVSLGCATASIKYRIGCLEYSEQDFASALDFFSDAVIEEPSDTSALLALANALHLRGDDFAAQGYYERLIEILEAEKARRGIMFPQVRIDDNELATAYMRAKNNRGVTLFHIARQTGDSSKIAQSLVDFSESARAWDSLTRNTESLVRLKSGNLATQNSQYAVRGRPAFEPEIYMEIPKTLTGEKVLR